MPPTFQKTAGNALLSERFVSVLSLRDERLSSASPACGRRLDPRIFEVLVFGRRSYARFSIEPSGQGVLRVLRDVIIQEIGSDELMVIGREAAAVGDSLTLELATLDGASPLNVRVVECRPLVVDGALRHRLRLQRIRL